MIASLNDKHILITGGSKGIGKALAFDFARRGARVFLVARGEADLVAAMDEINAAHPNMCTGYAPCDVGDASAARDAVAKAVEAGGGLFGLVNNAGVAKPKYFVDAPVEDFDDTMRIDYLGGVYFTKAALEHIPEGGFIAFTSSIAGVMGVFGYTSYCPAKFAQIGFAEALKQEVAERGITVSVLCPPDTSTPGYEDENKTKPFETLELSKTASLMKPETVAERYVDRLLRGQFLVTVNMESWVLCKLHGIAPNLSRGVMGYLMRQAQKKKPG